MKAIIAIAAAGAALIGSIVTAQADPVFSGTYDVWSATTFSSDATSTATIQQALPSAISQFGGFGSYNNESGSGTYSGQLNFTDNSDNTINGFFGDDSGTFTHTGCTSNGCKNSPLSASSYGQVTLFEFVLTLTQTDLLSISHDDGVSIFADGNTTTDLLALGDSAPTTDVTSTVTLGAGTYDLYYTEANGLPADLNVNATATAVPEPASIALLGAGLVGFGIMRRRRKKTA